MLWLVLALSATCGSAYRAVLASCEREIPGYVLNLDRRADRLKKLGQTLAEQAPWLAAATCRVAGVDGRRMTEETTVPPALIQAEVLHSAVTNTAITIGGPLTKGATALIFGHGLMWEHFLQQDFEVGIFMEDDVTEVHPGLEKFLCDLVDRSDWDVVQLQYGDGTLVKEQDLTLEHRSGWNTGMYLLTKSAARQLLQRQFPIGHFCSSQIDDPGCPIRSLRNFVSQPAAAMQTGSRADSDVQILGAFLQTAKLRDCPSLAVSKMHRPELHSPFA